MECTRCANAIKEEDKFCSNCGCLLDSSKQNISAGSRSVNVGIIGRDNNIKVEKIENYNVEVSKELTKYNREKIVQIPVSKRGMTIFGAINISVGFIGSLASIIGIFTGQLSLNRIIYYSHLPLVLALMVITGAFSLTVTLALKKHGFTRLPIMWGKGINIEDFNGKLAITKINSKCPICGGNIQLVLSNNEHIGVCGKNPKHRYEFDYTTFTGSQL